MSDNVAGAAAWLGGTEIVNDSRTTAYMRNGIKPGTMQVTGDCGCGSVLQLAGCDSEYTTPAEDEAPWYDPAIPESAEFAGFLTTEFEGLSSTYTRSITESIADGATLGRSRFGSRTLSWKGYLFGSSCCGVAYGLRWLGKTLQGTKNCGNNCFGDDLELLVCCPTIEAALGYGPSLICNGTFDNNTGSWAPSGDTSMTWTNAIVYEGPGAMRVINPIGGQITFNTDCLIPVTPNKSYRLALQVRGATGSGSEILGVIFNWYNSIGGFIGNSSFGDLGFDNDSDWSLREVTVMSPPLAATVTMEFFIGDMATLPNEAHIIDSVQFNQTNFAPVVDPFRTIKNVSLLEGPIITDERKMGSTCGGGCGGSTAIEVEFSLVGASPWLYSAPIPVVNCVPAEANAVPIIGATLTGTLSVSVNDVFTTLQSDDFMSLPAIAFAGNVYIILDPNAENGPPEYVQIVTHAAGANTITVVRGEPNNTTERAHGSGTFWTLLADCSPINCADDILQVLSGIFPGCAPPALPPVATYVGCATPDVNTWKAVYITAPRALWNSLSEVVPVITIQTGALPLVGVRLGFFTSADGNPCGDLITTPPQCDLVCDTLYLTAIPGNSRFYIDGRTNKMSLLCGTNSVFPGEPLTMGPFSWPSFDCYGFCMEFAFDPRFTNDQFCVSLSLVPRTTM